MFIFSPFVGRGPKLAGGPPVTASVIPLSFDDDRFDTNAEEATYRTYNQDNWLEIPQTFTNKDWDSRPTMWEANPNPQADPLGNECIRINFSSGMNVVCNKCRVFWREGWRVAGAGPDAKLTFNECYTQVIGIIHPITAEDHPDGLQADGPGDVTIEANNSVFHSVDDAKSAELLEPPASGGVVACGSDAFRWADNSYGTIKFRNVIIRGNGRGCSIYADQLTTNIDWENVYFIDEDATATLPSGSRAYYRAAIGQRNAGVINIVNWTNVRYATIVGGEIVPGDLIPEPVITGNTQADDFGI